MPTERVWNDSTNQLANPLSWTPNGALAAGDTARIPESARVQPTASLDISAAQIAEFIIDPGCPIGVGSDGDPAIIDALTMRLSGYGTVYCEPVNTGDKKIYVDSPNLDEALKIVSGDAGPEMNIKRGHVLWANPDGDMLYVNMTHGLDGARDAKLTIEETATLTNYINQASGRLVNHKPAGFCMWGGGEYVQVAGSVTNATLCGATVYWDGGGSFGGQAMFKSGLFDTTRVRRARSMGLIWLFPEAVYKYIPDLMASLPRDMLMEFGG